MTKIKELKEKDRVTLDLLVKSCTKGTTNKGASYLNLVLQDDTGNIDGKFWDAKADDLENVKAGRVQRVSFEVLEYNRNLQLRVFKVEDLDQTDIDYSQYVMTSGISQDEIKEKVQTLVVSIKNENIRILMEGMLEKVGKKFYQYPAASRIHHNYMGGLAEHSLGMAELAEKVCSLYPLLNRDLLIAGVLLHDMGKTAELGGLISAEYTEEGKLIGHISICQGWLMEVASSKGLENTEEAILLRHLILSHHGKMEFGSPVLPAIPEAEALFLIDNMDARMNTLRQQLDGVKPGMWTQKIFSLDNRQFYKTKLEK